MSQPTGPGHPAPGPYPPSPPSTVRDLPPGVYPHPDGRPGRYLAVYDARPCCDLPAVECSCARSLIGGRR